MEKYRISTLVNVLYPPPELEFKYQQEFQEKLWQFGTLCHQHIQRIEKRKNPYLFLEHSSATPFDNVELTFHIDMYDYLRKTVYEIKPKNYLEKNYDKCLMQASAYFHLVNAKKLILIPYELVYECRDVQPLTREETFRRLRYAIDIARKNRIKDVKLNNEKDKFTVELDAIYKLADIMNSKYGKEAHDLVIDFFFKLS